MLKQTLRALIVGLTVMPCGYGQQPVRMEVPAVTAKTNLASKSVAISQSGYTRTEQDGRQMSVNVEVRFFHALPAPYELQCFFISKNEYTKKMQVFDGMKKAARGQVFTWEFMSQPIAGSTRKFTSVPFSANWVGINSRGTVTSAGGAFGTSDSYSEKSGYKIEGWVVRIVGQGNVLRVESNQPALQQIAQSDEMTRQFDAIAARLGDEQRDGPMRFAPDARVVVPGTIFSTPPPLAPPAPPAPRRSIPAAPAPIAVVPAPPVPGAVIPASPALVAPPALGTVIPAPAAVGPLVANLPDPSTVRLQSPPGKARNPKSRVAEIKKPQETVFLNDTKNAVFQGAGWNSLTPEELALVNGLKIADIGLPKNRGYGYLKLFVMIDDSQVEIPPGQLLVTCRILCADAEGNLAVAQTADTIEVPERGRHEIVLGNSPSNDNIRKRNNDDGYPRNAYVEFRINDKVFRQVLLSSYGPPGWWTMDQLIPERF